MKTGIFNVRIDKRISRKLRSDRFEGILATTDLVCPHCMNRWPRFMRQERVNRTLRVSEKTISRLFDVSHPGKLFTNIIEHEHGYCPTCGQKR